MIFAIVHDRNLLQTKLYHTIQIQKEITSHKTNFVLK